MRNNHATLLRKISVVGGASAFITTWRTTGASETITLPVLGVSGMPIDCIIDWGDLSTPESVTSDYPSHEYAVAGDYDVSITGTFPKWYQNNTGDKTKIIDIKQYGLNEWEGLQSAFFGCSNLIISATDTMQSGKVTNFDKFMTFATSVNSDLNIDTSSGTVFSLFLYGATAFNSAINNDTSNGVNFTGFLRDAIAFNQELSIDTGKGEIFSDFLYGAISFNQELIINTSSGLNFTRFLRGATSFNQPLSINTSNGTLFLDFLRGATIFNQPIDIDLSSGTNLQAFLYQASAFDSAINTMNMSLCTNATVMFQNSGLTQTNYDPFLVAQAALSPLQPNVPFHGGTAKYSEAAARAVLTGAPNSWVITDGGAA